MMKDGGECCSEAGGGGYEAVLESLPAGYVVLDVAGAARG
jgi:hypothetical protein